MNRFELAEAVLRDIAPTERPGQVRALRAAVAAFDHRLQVALKAPTGTGKSLVGLVAGGISEGDRVLYATATNMLQDQYATEDMPPAAAGLARHGFPTDFVTLKGRRHYPCSLLAADYAGDFLDRGELALQIDGDDDGTPVGIRAVADWVVAAQPGVDWSDCPVPVTPGTHEMMTVDSDSCVGRNRCRFADQCHYYAMHDRAAEAKGVLVPHALFAVHVATGGAILGDFDYLVIDECHKFEDACIGAFTWELSTSRTRSGEPNGTLVKLGRLLSQVIPFGGSRCLEELSDLSRQFDATLDRVVGRQTGDVPLASASPQYLDALDDLLGRLRVVLAEADVMVFGYIDEHGGLDALPSAVLVKVRKIASAVTKLRGLIDMTGAEVPGIAMFATRSERALTLKIANVHVGPLLREAGWVTDQGAPRGVLMMSATIPDGYCERLGLDSVQHLAVDSPFDFERQAVVYVADDLPEASFKNRPQWEPAATARAFELADAALHLGGVLVLCSSFAQVKLFADALAPLLRRHPGVTWVVDDGETMEKAEILPRLQSAARPLGILSRGYFEGLNLPGKLASVIVTQVCYPVPGDPINNAMKELWPHEGWPHPIDQSKAATLLEQALGRLHRSPIDRGVLAVLDRRVIWGASANGLRDVLPKGAPVVGAEHGGWVLQWLASGVAVAA